MHSKAVITLRFQVNSTIDPHQKLKSVGVQPLGFGKGWSPSQGRNSASSKEKFVHIKKSKSVSPNTERTKQHIQKPHAEKKHQSIIIYTAKERRVEHLSCMRRIDRKRRPLAGGNAVGQPPTGGGRSLGCLYPQFRLLLGLRLFSLR